MTRRRLNTTKLTPYDLRVLINREAPNGCWEWKGKTDRDGYGTVWLGGTHKQAHREVFKALTGAEIDEGKELDHLCLNRKCVNPEHLECVEKLENIARRWGKGSYQEDQDESTTSGG